MQQIFIGSSSEKKDLAALIARKLAESDFFPQRWWCEFPLGSITFDRLVEITSEADGAVFIFGSDDKQWYRGEEVGVPRDNVILEYGMFSSKLGRSSVVIVKDPMTTLPSDVNGITYLPLSKDFESIAEEVILHFKNLELTIFTQTEKILTIHTDPAICNKQLFQNPPKGWSSRLLYSGITGAKNWISVIEDQKYQPKALDTMIIDSIRSELNNHKYQNIVSFGCGEGSVDREIFSNLIEIYRIKYVPVDINPYLVQETFNNIKEEIDIPFGIQADFEDNPSFIFEVLRKQSKGNSLFAFLGGTFGNIERYERRVLETIRSQMTKDDIFLLDIFTKSKNYTPNSDSRKCMDLFGVGQRRFLSYAISQKTGEPVEVILEDFEQRIGFNDSHSEVPGSYCFNILDVKNKAVITPIRRFDLQKMRAWLINSIGFNVIACEEYFIEGADIGRGYILLSAPNK